MPCVSYLYKHQPRQLLAAALCRRCLAVCPSLPCVRLACWPRPPFQQTAAGFYPARLALPVSVLNAPVLPVSRRFSGVLALRWCPVLARCPCARFGWCRCAYKVAAPVWPCFRPFPWLAVSLARPLPCWCPCLCTPSDISPHQLQRDYTPPHGRAVRLLMPPPLCMRWRAACWSCPAWLAGLAGGCFVAIAPCPLLAALLSRWGRIIIRQ